MAGKGGDLGGRRPKGSLNKRTVALRDISDKAIAAGITPLEVLLENMRFYHSKISQAEVMLAEAINKNEPTTKLIETLKVLCNFRNEAGKFADMAAPYCHNKKATLTVTPDPNNPFVMVHKIERVFTNQIEDLTDYRASDISTSH